MSHLVRYLNYLSVDGISYGGRGRIRRRKRNGRKCIGVVTCFCLSFKNALIRKTNGLI